MLFAGMDLRLAAGQAALVRGPNGAGKSSLLRILAGLLPPYAGKMRIEGTVGLADDRLALDPDRTLADALGFWAKLDGGDASDGMAAMAIVHLAPVPVRMLSTGQRKRATLARVIASRAPVWLLDEPANGLDEASLAHVGAAVHRHLGAGGIVVTASHQPLPWAADVELVIQPPAEADAPC